MALDQQRLKTAIRVIVDYESEQEGDPEESRERFATNLAAAIISEIKQAKIVYVSGLTSATGGPVTGNFQGELQ